MSRSRTSKSRGYAREFTITFVCPKQAKDDEEYHRYKYANHLIDKLAVLPHTRYRLEEVFSGSDNRIYHQKTFEGWTEEDEEGKTPGFPIHSLALLVKYLRAAGANVRTATAVDLKEELIYQLVGYWEASFYPKRPFSHEHHGR